MHLSKNGNIIQQLLNKQTIRTFQFVSLHFPEFHSSDSKNSFSRSSSTGSDPGFMEIPVPESHYAQNLVVVYFLECFIHLFSSVYLGLFVDSEVPGGFKKIRGTGRKNLDLVSSKSDPGGPSYDRNTQ